MRNILKMQVCTERIHDLNVIVNLWDALSPSWWDMVIQEIKKKNKKTKIILINLISATLASFANQRFTFDPSYPFSLI